MPKISLSITDERMLKLMDFCVANRLRGCQTNTDWLVRIGFSPSNLFNVRNGSQRFMPHHLHAAGKEFNADMNYIFGFTDYMFRQEEEPDLIANLKQTLAALELKIGKTGKQKLKQRS